MKFYFEIGVKHFQFAIIAMVTLFLAAYMTITTANSDTLKVKDDRNASATPYAYAGVWLIANANVYFSVKEADRGMLCFGEFRIISEDGTYSTYAFDPVNYSKNNALKYNLVERGACQLDQQGIESCTLQTIDQKNIQYAYKTTMKSRDAIDLVSPSSTASEPEFVLRRCSFTRQQISRLLADEFHNWSNNIVQDGLLHSKNPQLYNRALKLVEALRAELQLP